MGRADERRARQKGARAAQRAAKGKTKKKGIRRFFTWKLLLVYFLTVCVLVIGAFITLYLIIKIPPANALAKAQGNVYTYRDGTPLARTGDVNRELVSLSKVPEEVQHTFVAAENKDFYTDSGVSISGTARGIINTMLGKGKQGGSTITQQYVKNYYLSQEQTVSRKVKELIISLKVDKEKSKDYILEGYINTSYYGRGAYGIQAAARAYYNKPVEKLTVEQGAYLAAVLQAPSQYDWQAAGPNGRKLVKERWHYVLDNMVEKEWLDAGRRKGMDFPIPIEPRPISGLEGRKGYLVNAANQELYKAGVDEKELAAGGYTITLNIDKDQQKQLESAVEKQLTDKLDPKKRPVDGVAQTGAASVDPKTGEVLALYGGAGYTKHYVNNATRTDYQAASTFKPLVYAAALEDGSKTRDGVAIRSNTIYDGDSRRPVVGGSVPFAPPNEDNVDFGPITVREAMAHSVNSVFAQMGADVGVDRVKQTAVKLGMDPKTSGFVERPSMALGVMGASPLEMAGVYASLDNHGKLVTPRVVKSAVKRDAEVDGLPEPVGGQVISRDSADAVTKLLTGVVDDGTGKEVQSLGQEVAGKTGTSDDNKSAWFVGYTPNLVTAVAMFGEQPEDKGEVKRGAQVAMYGVAGKKRINGGGFPAKIWAAYMNAALSGKEAATFDLESDLGPAASPVRTQAPQTQSPTSKPTTETPTPTKTKETETPTPTKTKETQTPTTPTPTRTTQTPTPTKTTQTPTQEPTDEPSTEDPEPELRRQD
ncbi:transglycosylase domain-containing protein [Streptomyces sp. LX-29]|uniref:transglycosylase domain-containing protein n=1 Tax=Streptomyces sp. LX-29 TaxID=2900152 RepID=UPI00240E5112|nr:transglycosylase domain-containing protein [Streptomyces sp. LX-29]WFB11596.1 transglycosylase domain-containing protein [Streptomyces sp. LX-29]